MLFLFQVLIETAKRLGLRCHSKGTIVTIEGPRFSSRAESSIFRTWGADVINMTTVPEVVLAKEAGICYASIAMATDYDCWKEHEEAVSGSSFWSLEVAGVGHQENVSLVFFGCVSGPLYTNFRFSLSFARCFLKFLLHYKIFHRGSGSAYLRINIAGTDCITGT